MNLIDRIYKAKYSAKHYQKYCKNANEAFIYATIYLNYNDSLDDLPIFVQDIYYMTLFLSDSLNLSMYMFFYDENHYKHVDKVRRALQNAKMDEALSIFELAVETFKNVNIDHDKPINYLKENVPYNVQYNINFYEEELAKLQQNDYLYNQANNYFLEQLRIAKG